MKAASRFRLLAVGVGLAGLVLTGCGSSSSTSGSNSGGDSAETINVAVMAPLTGTAALEGENAKNAGTMAVDAINSTTSGRKIAVTYYDTKADPAQAANIATKLTSDYQSGAISAVVGPAHSDEALAALPIFARSQVPVIGTTPSNPSLTQKGFTNFIRMVPSDADQTTQQVAFAYNNLKKRKFAIFYENNDFGQGLKDYQVEAIKGLSDASLVGTETYIPGQTRDFSTQVTNIARENPDVVLLDTGYTEGGLILRQASQQGFKTTWVASGNNLYQDFITLSEGAANGVYVLTSFNRFSDDPTTQEFLKKYQEAYKSVPAEGAYTTYDALFLVQKLINGGTASADLIATAKSQGFTGVGGDYKWTEQGDVNMPLSVNIVKDDQFVDSGQQVDLTGF